ncbi:MAG: DNA alkylation repair protein [Planctomycetota bacterium]|nr:DNA alkylation repair protein [Planctomycetota bacterium]MDA1113075.1 DNA alkylation repair protein [Planctomycetota bacterium]
MAEPLKNRYNHAFLKKLATVVSDCSPNGIDQVKFKKSVLANGWEELELKARMRRITECLRLALPEDYLEALPIMRDAAPHFGDYLSMFFPDFVEVYGMEHWEESVDALWWMTRFGSSEFAVRPFLKADAPRMLRTMLAWTRDENEHVRRLASEGSRPLLPWAMNLPAFQKDPLPVLPLLDALKDDSSEYVRRSVANNLNDIAKDHPQLVLKTAQEWNGHSKERDKLVKHACRTLLKNGDAGAMRLFGFRNPNDLQVSGLQLKSAAIALGSELHFSFTLSSPNPLGKVRLEYLLEFARPHGRGARKVFKISESDSTDVQRCVTRRHSLVDRSTRKHYVGEHRITVIVNGVAKASAKFVLK